jgi:hypothetical protein
VTDVQELRRHIRLLEDQVQYLALVHPAARPLAWQQCCRRCEHIALLCWRPINRMPSCASCSPS